MVLEQLAILNGFEFLFCFIKQCELDKPVSFRFTIYEMEQ